MVKEYLDRPIFIIGCNRSGTTLLFQNLSMHPSLWSLYIEGQHAFHRCWPLDQEYGDRVEAPATPDTRRALVRDLYNRAHNKEFFLDIPVAGSIPTKLFQRPLGRLYKKRPIRLVEKTPANTLRIPMLARSFPDARFVFIVRRGEAVISSLMEGWKRWNGMPEGQPWVYKKWHYLAPPNWQDWIGRPLEEICMFQWYESTRAAQEDLDRWAPERYLRVRHEDLVSDPVGYYREIERFCELEGSPSFQRISEKATDLAYTRGGSAPRSGKWRRLHYDEIMRVRDTIESMNARYYDDPSLE